MAEGIGAHLGDLGFSNPYLQGIHDMAVPVLGSALRSHRFSSGQELVFEIVTDALRLRTQYVTVTLGDLFLPDRPALTVSSRVGTLLQLDHALLALKMARDNPFTNVSIDEDSHLRVSLAYRHATEATASEVCQQVGVVAKLADALEEAIFGWDRT